MSAKSSTATKAKKASASSIADFKKRKKGTPIELPSGLVVVARRVSLTSFLQRGEVPNALMDIVQEALQKGQNVDPASVIGVDGDDQTVDLEMVNDMFEMVNDIVKEMVVEPKIHPLPEVLDEDNELVENPTPEEVEEAKDDDLLYIDELDEDDKMFLFQWATGGTADIANFREEASASLDALAQSKKLQQRPQPTDRARKR